ncbi:MAG: CBS domain-containing protein [Candidatus Dormibacteria bacterium]
MDPPPAPLHPDSELRAGVQALIDTGLVALPVTDNGSHLVGLLDEEDLLVLAEDPHLVEQEAEIARFWPLGGGRRAVEHLRVVQARRVSEVMRHRPPSVRASSRIDQAAEAMADHHAGVLTRRALLQAWWAGRLC